MRELYIIAGPTACGKTAYAVKLAKELRGEVVSADSMQVYRGMDIGTAKPTVTEREGVPHHMIDVADPDEPFSVALYQRMAAKAVADIQARGNVPILAGGTGFYINAVLYGNAFGGASGVSGGAELSQSPYDMPGVSASGILSGTGETRSAESCSGVSDIRARLESLAEERGNQYLHEELTRLDPDYAAVVHSNNVRRVINALAFFYANGKKLSEHNKEQHKLRPKYDARFIVLDMERGELYRRIDLRVLQMFERGLADEVRGLLDAGFHTGLTSMQGIGYKETAAYLQGRITRNEAVELVQRNTRRYAKRQLTWFRHQAKGAEVISASKLS